MSRKRVAIVTGGRTPFIRAGRAFAEIDSLGMAVHAVRGMLDRSGIDPAMIESVVFGTMTPDPLKPNLARELVFEAGLPIGAEAHTVASYCITGSAGYDRRRRCHCRRPHRCRPGRRGRFADPGVSWTSSANRLRA